MLFGSKGISRATVLSNKRLIFVCIRIFLSIQQALNPKSPYAKFSVGSLETLADRKDDLVRDDLLNFYSAHYSANLMALVVLANEPYNGAVKN
jgi:secreted Zn-dependent insulinase-like peptidase